MWGNIITILFVSGYPCISESVVYRLQRTERSFQHSLSHCVWMFDGLAEIYNAKQQQYLSLIAGGKEVWIGVSRCQQNWCYTGSGRMVSYTNWAKGEPNNYYSFIFGEENCVLMLSSREWNDENCSDKNYSVCQQLQCKATTCNRRGRCIELTDGFRCTCDQGFYGNNCENEQCKATTCNRRGTCTEMTGGLRCICDQGFYGNNCENEQCKATSCNRRGTCIELTGGFRCICDQGFYGNNCENVRSCPVITKPNHSTVNCEGLHGKNHFQSVSTFTCDRGFILNGNISATCQASGSWTTYNTICQEQCKATSCNRRGTCIELTGGFRCICDQGFYGNNCENVRSCPVITKPNHSTVNCEGLHGKNHFQSVCTFTCDRGFILNGNISATCQASGSWTTYNTICQAITCTLLKKPEYSSVNCSGPYGEKHYNTSCYFSCDDGYTLEGDHKTVCKESGNWNSYDVQCTVNHLKLILIIVSMGAVAVALLVLSVICWWKRRNRQEQNNTNDDLPMQLKNSTYASHDIYVLPTCLDNETPQDEMYVNNLSTVQDMYKNLE